MKLVTIAIGAGMGYLAGNADARAKTWAALKQAKQSPSAKSLEDKVSGAVEPAVGPPEDRLPTVRPRRLRWPTAQSSADPLVRRHGLLWGPARVTVG